MPRSLLEIQTTPPHVHPTLVTALEPILVVTMPGVAETFKTFIDEMTHGTDFKLFNLLQVENVNLTHKDLNTCIDEPENWWKIHLVSSDTLTSRAKPSSNGQLSYCSWSFGIFDESRWYKTKNSVGWQSAMNAKVWFKLQLTTTPGFHSQHDWCYQIMWLFAGASDDPENDTVMKKHGAEALYSTVKSLMHAIWTRNEEAQLNAAHRMIQIAKPCTIRRWSESKIADGKQHTRIPKGNAHLMNLEWTEDEQANLKTLVERYTSQGASGAWRVHRWRLACFSLVMGDPEDGNDNYANGTRNGDMISGWILWFSDCWERHFCKWLSRNLWSIMNLTRMTNEERRYFWNTTEMKMHSPAHLLHRSLCHFLLFLAKFVIWRGS